MNVNKESHWLLNKKNIWWCHCFLFCADLSRGTRAITFQLSDFQTWQCFGHFGSWFLRLWDTMAFLRANAMLYKLYICVLQIFTIVKLLIFPLGKQRPIHIFYFSRSRPGLDTWCQQCCWWSLWLKNLCCKSAIRLLYRILRLQITNIYFIKSYFY